MRWIVRPLSGWWRLERRFASTAAKLPGGWAEDVEQLFTEQKLGSCATEWNHDELLALSSAGGDSLRIRLLTLEGRRIADARREDAQRVHR